MFDCSNDALFFRNVRRSTGSTITKKCASCFLEKNKPNSTDITLTTAQLVQTELDPHLGRKTAFFYHVG